MSRTDRGLEAIWDAVKKSSATELPLALPLVLWRQHDNLAFTDKFIAELATLEGQHDKIYEPAVTLLSDKQCEVLFAKPGFKLKPAVEQAVMGDRQKILTALKPKIDTAPDKDKLLESMISLASTKEQIQFLFTTFADIKFKHILGRILRVPGAASSSEVVTECLAQAKAKGFKMEEGDAANILKVLETKGMSSQALTWLADNHYPLPAMVGEKTIIVHCLREKVSPDFLAAVLAQLRTQVAAQHGDYESIAEQLVAYNQMLARRAAPPTPPTTTAAAV